MKIKVWVEVMTVQRWTESIEDVPDEQWLAMTGAEREAYKMTLFENMLSEVANGGAEEIED